MKSSMKSLWVGIRVERAGKSSNNASADAHVESDERTSGSQTSSDRRVGSAPTGSADEPSKTSMTFTDSAQTPVSAVVSADTDISAGTVSMRPACTIAPAMTPPIAAAHATEDASEA